MGVKLLRYSFFHSRVLSRVQRNAVIHAVTVSPGGSNQTPLDLASRAGHLGVVQLPVESSVNVDVRNVNRTPVEEQSVNEHHDVTVETVGARR